MDILCMYMYIFSLQKYLYKMFLYYQYQQVFCNCHFLSFYIDNNRESCVFLHKQLLNYMNVGKINRGIMQDLRHKSV